MSECSPVGPEEEAMRKSARFVEFRACRLPITVTGAGLCLALLLFSASHRTAMGNGNAQDQDAATSLEQPSGSGSTTKPATVGGGNAAHAMARRILEGTPAPTPQEIERMAAIYLHLGLIKHTRTLLKEYFDEPDTTRERTVEANILEAEAILLTHTFGEMGGFREHEAPSELARRRIRLLNAAEDHASSALSCLGRQKSSDKSSAERFAQLLAQLSALRARILIAKGDISFRLRAASLVGEVTDKDPGSASALAYYADARQYAYESTAIRATVQGETLADDVDQRIEWLRDGRFFGGLAFFEVPSVMGEATGGAHPLARLENLLKDDGELERAQKAWGASLVANTDKAVEIGRQIIDAAKRNEHRKRQRVHLLGQQIFDLQQEIGRLQEDGKNLLATEDDRLRQLLFKDDERNQLIDQQARLVRGEVLSTTKELSEAIHDLSLIGKRNDLLSVEGISVERLSNQLDKTHKAGTNIIRLLSDVTDTQDKALVLKEAMKELKASIDGLQAEGASKLMEARNGVTFASAAITEAKAVLESEVNSLMAEELRQAQAKVEEDVGFVRQQVLDLQLKILNTDSEDEVSKLKAQLAKNVVEKMTVRRKEILDHLDKVQSHINEAKKFRNEVQKTGQTIEKAIAAVQTAGTFAAATPSGIIAGLSSGTFFDKSGIVEAAKAAADLLKHTEHVLLTIEDVTSRVRELQNRVDKYKSALTALDAQKISTELKRSIEELKASAEQDKNSLRRRIAQRNRDIQAKVQEMSRIKGQILQANRRSVSALIGKAKALIAQEEAKHRQALGLQDMQEQEARALARRVATLRAQLSQLQTDLDRILETKLAYSREKERFKGEISGLTEDQVAQLGDAERKIMLRIRTVEEEIQNINQGQHHLDGFEMPVEQLVALAAGPSATAEVRDYRGLLGETNRLLFTYANWLYIMTGKAAALRWAIMADNVGDARTIKLKLDSISGLLHNQLDTGRLAYFGVRMTRDDLIKRAPHLKASENSSGAILFTVAPHMKNSPRRPDPAQEKIVSGYPFSIERPLPFLDDLIFAPSVDLMPSFKKTLLDVYVIPEWNNQNDVGFNVDHARIGIEAVGPSGSVFDGQLKEFPVHMGEFDENGHWLDYLWGHEATVSDEDGIRKCHDGIREFFDSDKSLLAGEYSANYRLALGRGLAGTWRLLLPQAWVSGVDPEKLNNIDHLNHVTVVFLFLSAGLGTESAGDGLTDPIALPRLDVASIPNVAGQHDVYADTLPAYELDQRRADMADNGREFRSSPAGRLARLQMLRRTASLLPSYEQLAFEEQPLELTEPQHLLIKGGEDLIESWSLTRRFRPVGPISGSTTRTVPGRTWRWASVSVLWAVWISSPMAALRRIAAPVPIRSTGPRSLTRTEPGTGSTAWTATGSCTRVITATPAVPIKTWRPCPADSTY